MKNRFLISFFICVINIANGSMLESDYRDGEKESEYNNPCHNSFNLLLDKTIESIMYDEMDDTLFEYRTCINDSTQEKIEAMMYENSNTDRMIEFRDYDSSKNLEEFEECSQLISRPIKEIDTGLVHFIDSNEDTIMGVHDHNGISTEEFNRFLVGVLHKQTEEIEALDSEENTKIDKPKRYQCDQCTKYSSDRRFCLERHKASHRNEHSFKCNHEGCNHGSNSLSNLRVHEKTHRYERLFRCDHDKCFFKTKYKQNLNKHKKIHIVTMSEEVTNLLDSVPKQIVEVELLNIEEDSEIYKAKKYQCDKCSFSVDRFDSLRRHKIIHTNKKAYKCNDCTFSTHHPYTLVSHKKTIHNDDKAFKCDECLFESHYRSDLTRHRKKVHIFKELNDQKLFKCDVDGCTFLSKFKSFLIRHRIVIHTNK